MSIRGNAPEYQRMATDIAQRIVGSSIWYEGRCNWLGAEPILRGQSEGITYVALGPELYSGTSGIALFLAEATVVADDPAIRRTALGAIRHSLSRLESVPPNARLGLFTGWPGILLAAVRVGMLLNVSDLIDQALTTMTKLPDEICSSDEFDLTSGKAGGIAALLVLHDLLRDNSSLDLSIQLGEQLIESAHRSNEGWSWKSPGFRTDRNLTGLSHGVAGAGYALLELHAATHDERFLEAAKHAFRYEQSLFSPNDRNWPDFRRNPDIPRQGRTRKCLSFWCHGAPGIALSRIRAYELLKESQLREEAEIASDTTAESLQNAVAGWTGNFSLCHGLAGNADVLHHSEATLCRSNGGAALVRHVANYGIERYGYGKEDWPSGTHSGTTPGLMLGLAGIGHFYLRLCEMSTPSILLPRRSEWQPVPSRSMSTSLSHAVAAGQISVGT